MLALKLNELHHLTVVSHRNMTSCAGDSRFAIASNFSVQEDRSKPNYAAGTRQYKMQ